MRDFDINKPAPARSPFVVPDGYFAQFADTMMQRIRQMDKPVHDLPVVRWIPWLGAACVAALVVVFTQFVPLGSEGGVSADVAASSAAMSYEDAAYDYLIMANADNLTTYANDF